MPDVQKPEYQVHVMGDAAEIIRYDRAAVPLYIRQGSLSCYSHRRALIHWHDDLEFIRVYEGRMRYAVNAHDLLLGPGDVLVVNSRQMHGGRAADENDCRFLCVLVRPQLLTGSPVLYREQVRPFVEQPGLECLHFAAGTPQAGRLGRALDAMADASETAGPAWELAALGQLAAAWGTLLQAARAAAPAAGETDADLARQRAMVQFIYRHYAEKLTLADIAAAGGVCRSKCCALFARYAQQPPIEYLNRYRLEVSCDMLRRGGASVTEVALACGFSSPAYFAQQFGRRYGCTPRAWRAACKP